MLYYKFHQIKGNFQSLMGKWFARTITNGTLETEEVAQLIQNNCTVKYSDVLAVLKELQEVLTDKLQEGYSVHLENIGYFKISASSKVVDSLEEFNQTSDMRSPRVIFTPESTRVKNSDGKYHKVTALTYGVTLREMPKNENTTD